ncbi:MAG TPA: NAD(P)H-dependent oxidoreductase subunit E, partial [Aliarcobacter cryaerophilus]|nr:NAD(P)H-dependent oxidoreductase subunit E [Aliarcobacter cryaerophilus]
YVAEKVQKSPMQVYEVATFYTMFNLKPIGKHHIELCKTVSCMLMGARELKAYIKETLGLEPGQTSADGLFTFSEVECQGACGDAPMIALNNVYHGKLTKEKLEKIIWECKNDN